MYCHQRSGSDLGSYEINLWRHFCLKSSIKISLPIIYVPLWFMAQYLPFDRHSLRLNSASQLVHDHETIRGVKVTSGPSYLLVSLKFLTKSRALSLVEVYQSSQLTLLSKFLNTNSAEREALAAISAGCFVKKSFNIYPSFFPMSIAGMRIPVPVPSSDIITLLISSKLSSIITARLPPALSTLRTFVTKVQWPLSTKKIGVRMPSGSPEKSSVKFDFAQPSPLEAL